MATSTQHRERSTSGTRPAGRHRPRLIPLPGAPPSDALFTLSAYLVVTLAIPSKYTIAALGGAGSLSTVIGLLALGSWFLLHLSRSAGRAQVVQPQRRALFIFLLAALASFVAAARRPGGGQELWYSQFALLLLFAWTGVTLLASDFLVSWSSIHRLVNRIALAAGFYACLGIVQYFSGLPLTNNLPLPGLHLNQSIVAITDRGGLNRPASTAIHAIEFGVVMTALLPLCLHVLLHSTELSRARRWFPVASIAIATPLCISRSAIICAVVALLMLLPTWPGRTRTIALSGLLLVWVAIFVSAPGVVGTLIGLFTGAAQDSSALSRTGSYALAGHFIAQHPLFGRGIGTFLPSYRILDNQYLGFLIEIGLVGTTALLVLFFTTMVCMWMTRLRANSARVSDLAASLVASTASIATGYAFFDGFSFQQYASVTFLILGIAGAVWRLSLVERRGDSWRL